jgi:hypothetical protein
VEYWDCLACTDYVHFDEEEAFVVHVLQEHHNTISKDQIHTLKSACKRSAPAEISSCPLCAWPTAEEGEVDREVLIEHIAEDVHAFSLHSLPWGPDDEQQNEKRIEEGALKVQVWLTEHKLSLATTREIPPTVEAERPSMPHYFKINEYFAENTKSDCSSEIDSNNSVKQELMKLREECSLAYSDSLDGIPTEISKSWRIWCPRGLRLQ